MNSPIPERPFKGKQDPQIFAEARSFLKELNRFLTAAMMKWFRDNYLPDTGKRKEVYAFPLQAGPDELKGLPPALVQTAENDVLGDKGEAYARKLNEAGVPVTRTRYNGLIHDYELLNSLSTVPAVQLALLPAAAVIKEALNA